MVRITKKKNVKNKSVEVCGLLLEWAKGKPSDKIKYGKDVYYTEFGFLIEVIFPMASEVIYPKRFK